MTINISCLFLIMVLVLKVNNTVLCQVPPDDKRPNILFIVTDDQSPFSLKAYGNKICQTPNIDRIVKNGMTIEQAYIQGSWQSAVCIPSRTQIMTGRSIWRTVGLPGPSKFKGLSASEANQQLQPSDPEYYSMPAIFNRAGYTTFRTCKPTTSYESADILFTYNYERWCVYADDENGSKWHGDKAIDFLNHQQSQRADKPFLMYVGFSHPHDPRHGTQDLYDKYGASDEPPNTPNAAAPPLPANYLPEHPFHHGNDKGRDETRVQGVMTNRDEATVRNEIGRQYACIEGLDVQIGRILDKLAEIGELENTYIFFCGDNGIAIGSHGLMGKQNLYEHSWRVPLIVSGPGIERNSRAKGNIYLMDVLSTMCDMVGIKTPSSSDGKSFFSVLKGETSKIREVMYGVFNVKKHRTGNGSRPGIRAVRKGDWKLIKYDVYEGEVHETQLFNLKDNPHELLKRHHDPAIIKLSGHTPQPYQVNLAGHPAFSKKLLEMEKVLLEQQHHFNDPYRLWNQMEILAEINKNN